jgi:subtilisin family serine protease
MRTRPSPSRLTAVAACAIALGLGAAGANAQDTPQPSIDEAGWQGVLGVRASISATGRYVVLLDEPSLAERVAANGGTASEAQTREWTGTALRVQEQFLARLTAAGAKLIPDYRYVRVLNGFSTRLDPVSLALVEADREVVGVYPVRIAYPAQVSEPATIAPSLLTGLEVPGLDGTGVTVALLDTGVDPSHPYLRDSILEGIDLLEPGSGAVAQPHPTIPGRPEGHATQLAGIVTGSDGPDGLHGVAPGSSILPIRVVGWQADAEGGYTVYSRTDQLIAGLETAVDPNGDGDVLDAARVALVGAVEPYASFPDGPLARAVTGATVLDVLVVSPAGNDGRVGPAFGSIAGPGGAPRALTVAAADGRPDAPTVRVLVRAGLRVLFEGRLPLGGAPREPVTAGVVPVTRGAARKGTAGLFDAAGLSRVAGKAPLLPRGVLSDVTIEEATAGGAVAVLVDGRLPAGAFSLDVPEGVPVVGLPDALVTEIREMLRAGIPVTVSVGAVDVAPNEEGNLVAAFSSRGLAAGGGLKPDLVAAGVAVPTSEPGRTGDEGEPRYGTVSGTSVAAAVVAGAAATLAEGRPQATATELASLLVGSAQRRDLDATASGAGLVDLRGAVQSEIVVEPATISFGVPRGPDLEQPLRIRNVSTRPLSVSIQAIALAPRGVEITVDPAELEIQPGRTGTAVVVADTGSLSERAGVATGELALLVADSTTTHVPWAVAVPDTSLDVLTRLRLTLPEGRITDATPAVLGVTAGAVTTVPGLAVRPLEALEVRLYRSGVLLGLLARRTEVLPGRYTFALTGRGPGGDRLPRGTYTVRVQARQGEGIGRQVESIEYRVR